MLKFWYLTLFAFIFSMIANYLALLGPMYLGNAMNAISNKTGVLIDEVIYNFWQMLFCYITSFVLSYLLTIIMVILSQKITYLMRKQLFEKLTILPIAYFDTHSTGDIISRISYDIDTVNATLSTDLIQVVTSIYTVIGSLYFMIMISKPLILVFVITVPISIIFTKLKAKKIQPLFRLNSKKLGELNGFAEEMLSGAKTIGAYYQYEDIIKKFDQKNDAAVEAYYNAEYYGAMIGPSVNFINNLSISLVMIFGGILYLLSQKKIVTEGQLWFITIGGITQFVMYSRKFAGPINEFANIISEFQSAYTAAERIFRIIDEEPEPLDNQDAIVLENTLGDVELKNVEFGYTEEKMIIHNLSFHAEPGKTIAIVGPTGAGKTTMVKLLMRFYDVSSGEILIDGINIKDFKRSDLRSLFGMVLQDTWLFSGTIAENIKYGKLDASLEDVKDACRAASVHHFIKTLPDGYDMILNEESDNISQGQKQLLTIARVILANPKILILDEATSSVDTRTEVLIQDAMDKLMEGRTSFVIAHRLSTIKNADMILVMKNGDIVETGNHEELLKKNGFYATLYNSQFEDIEN